ncbi:hypothetical protein BGZ65_004824 [Modicella reniformis]|uniref:Uncharacterized protein n=1 Tax=Modicella reniformis TaxID=1440133 RepID=A0A9P6M8R4_9FUNG|nr:hypothetical protein BGZ65_004824 [Modicella reniformis]
MQQLKEVVIVNDEKYHEEAGKTKITIESDALANRIYEALREVRWLQSLENQWFLSALDLKLGYHRSITTTTAHIIINLNNMDSLILDFGRLSLTTGISPDGTQNMKIEVEKLGDLISVDVELIQLCHHKELVIKNSPLETDMDRLINILQDSCKLEVLRIGPIVLLLSSTWSRQHGRRLFKVENQPCYVLSRWLMKDWSLSIRLDDHNHIATTLKFSENTKVFDMRTRLRLGNKTAVTKNDPVRDYFRQYGWTIEILHSPSTFDDHLASLQITTLAIVPSLLTKPGMDALDHVAEFMLTRLIGFKLQYATLDPGLIEAIDFAMLNSLELELELLVVVANDMPQVRLRSLTIGKDLLDNDSARLLCAKLRKKLPLSSDDGQMFSFLMTENKVTRIQSKCVKTGYRFHCLHSRLSRHICLLIEILIVFKSTRLWNMNCNLASAFFSCRVQYQLGVFIVDL